MDNMQLVEFCKKALSEGCGYVWGTFGQKLNENILREKIHQYPTHVGIYSNFIKANWLGKRTMDCAGLIKAFLWDNNGVPTYNSETDYNVGMFAGRTVENGTMDSIPKDVIGLLVWKKGHIGVYIGDGKVIEANSTKRGVIQTSLEGPNSTGWTHWGKCHLIKYLPGKEEASSWAVTSWKKACTKLGKDGNPILDGTNPRGELTREMAAKVFDNLGLLD